MMFLLFVSVLFGTATAATCPNGYSDFAGNGLCYKRYLQPMLHSDAEATCIRDNARLIHIHNAFENTQMSHNTNGFDMWVGLRCTRSSPFNCYWDDDGSVASTYNNFCGPPDISEGYCTLMSGTKGCWRSANCEGMFLPFVCQYDPSNSLTNCGGDYKIYNGGCYKFYTSTTNSFWNAEYQCQADCGFLVSIHDTNENNFIVSSVEIGGQSRTNLVYIGLQRQSSSNFYWTDSSPYNYNNFVNGGDGTDKCAALAVFDDKVLAGQWTEVDCNDQLSYVCKKDSQCMSSTPYYYTQEPAKCTTRYLNERGTIQSPGYPGIYPDIPQSCEYRLTVSQGQVQLTFAEITLDPNSNIELYSDFSIASTPFLNITGPCRSCASSISSPTDEMRVQFNSDRLPSDNIDNYRWRANFASGQDRSGCNQTLTGSGTITSTNYPNAYPNSIYCSYLLHSQYDGVMPKKAKRSQSQQGCGSWSTESYSTEMTSSDFPYTDPTATYPSYYRIELDFTSIYTETSFDPIRIYDGDSIYSPLIAELSGYYPYGCYYQSSGNYMLVTFSTDGSGTFPGWTANFYTIYGY